MVAATRVGPSLGALSPRTSSQGRRTRELTLVRKVAILTGLWGVSNGNMNSLLNKFEFVIKQILNFKSDFVVRVLKITYFKTKIRRSRVFYVAG